MDDIIAAVDEALPRFNTHLLTDYPNDQVNGIADVLSMAFEEAMKFLRNLVTYEGYTILSPEERLQFELAHQRANATITNSELYLVAFNFVYNGKRFTVHLYLPYLIDGQIILRNTRYGIQYGITEKIFSRSDDGITVRVIRQPLYFWRGMHFVLRSAVSSYQRTEFVVGAKLHTKDSRKRDVQTTIVHYFLCKFGFNATIQRFGLLPSQISFVDAVGTDTEEFEYFLAHRDVPNEGAPGVYLRVAKEALLDPTWRKLVANVLYLLSKRYHHTVAELYEPGNTIYRIYLGEILYGQIGEGMAKSQADTHIYSVDYFLDPMTRDRLHVFGVEVTDIWDLLQYLFVEIDRILVSSTHQNLYEKRMVITDLFVIKLFITPIYQRIYMIDQNPNRLDSNALSKALGLRPNGIRGISRVPNVEPVGNSNVNGNRLFAFGLRKIRLSGSNTTTQALQSPDLRFDASIPVVETLVGFAGNNAAINGMINPYVKVTPEGGILRPEYAAEIEKIRPYLPYG